MKTWTFTAVILMTLGLGSCTFEANTLRNDVAEEVRWYSGEFQISRWEKVCDEDGLNGYYRANVMIPQLQYSILRGGQVNCYMFLDGNAQAPLPCVRHYENLYGQTWTRTIDYEYYDGGITVFVTDSDFAGDVPDILSFRIMLAW